MIHTATKHSDRSFSRKRRLVNAKDYTKVFSNARKISTSEFLFLISKNNQDDSRLGLAIAKKNIPRAVDRNRVKRLVRESFRDICEQLQSQDVVVLGRKKLVYMNNKNIRSCLDSIWKKVNIQSLKN